MKQRDGGSVNWAPTGVAAAIVLVCSALGLVSCQALGLSGSIGTSTGSPGAFIGPSPAIVADTSSPASGSSAAATTATGYSASPSSGDAASAADTVRTYLDALISGRYSDAWSVLAARARQAWGTQQQFVAERGAYYASAGATVDVSDPDNTAQTLATWIPFGFDGDRQRAYVVKIDHPRIESNASREVLIVAPDSSGEWRIWIGR